MMKPTPKTDFRGDSKRMRVLVLAGTLVVPCAIQAGAGEPGSLISPLSHDPGLLRQGGDTIETAVEITYQGAPYAGTTTGYTDDYDSACPWIGSKSPDVVYSLVAGGTAYETWIFDLSGSSYDTKIYVYDSSGEVVGCDDDGNPDFTSRLAVCLLDHDTYYIIIDGHGGDHGDYVLDITLLVGAVVDCAPGLWPEDETLEDEVLDTYNCGCDCADGVPRVSKLPGDADGVLLMCGGLGWTTVAGELHGDTDWLSLMVGPTGTVHGEIISTEGFNLPVVLPSDCDGLEILQVVEIGAVELVRFDILAEPGQELWLVPNTPAGDPPCGGATPQEYEYELHLWGLEVAVGGGLEGAMESGSWSAVKTRYR